MTAIDKLKSLYDVKEKLSAISCLLVIELFEKQQGILSQIDTDFIDEVYALYVSKNVL